MLDLRILQYLEQLLGLGLGWVIFSIPPTKHVTLLGLELSTCRVRVKHLGVGLGLSTLGLGLGLSVLHSDG